MNVESTAVFCRMLPDLTHQHIETIKKSTGSAAVTEKLKAFSARKPASAAVIKSYHDLLLFHKAFPANKKILELAVSELNRLSLLVKNIYEGSNIKWQLSLMGTGIANSNTICSYSYPITQWLSDRFPDQVQWQSCKASKEFSRNILQLMLPQVEYEKSSQGDLYMQARLERVSGLHKPNDQLRWLLQLFDSAPLSQKIKEEIYLQWQIYIRWQLKNTAFSRTFLCLPVENIFYQKGFIKVNDSTSILAQKLSPPSQLSYLQKNALLDIIRASLACYNRETEAIMHADPEDIELFDLGRGLQVALIGMKKERRLSLESYFGYMAFKNGIPVSYGGGWIWGERCKIGINIYPPFRSGESAWLFCQIMRVYYQYFKVRHFIVKPYQFGKGNPEGLKSGAFWFYYKLGFRPANENIKLDAAIEWEKINCNKNYKTPIAILRHFTSSHKEWMLAEHPIPSFDAGKISAAITEMINREYGGERNRAITECSNKMKKALPLRLSRRTSVAESQVMENWSLLTGLISGIDNWTKTQKKELSAIIQSKISGKERDYVLKLQKHWKFWNCFQNIGSHQAVKKSPGNI